MLPGNRTTVRFSGNTNSVTPSTSRLILANRLRTALSAAEPLSDRLARCTELLSDALGACNAGLWLSDHQGRGAPIPIAGSQDLPVLDALEAPDARWGEALVSLPLMAEDRYLGLLALGRERPFDEEELGTAALVAELFGQCIARSALQQTLLDQGEAMAKESRKVGAGHRFGFRIIDRAPVGIAHLDRHLSVRWTNPALRELFGIDGSELPPALRSEILQRMGEQMMPAGGSLSVPEVLVPVGNAPFRFFDVTLVVDSCQEGHEDGLLLFAVDVTDRMDKLILQVREIRSLQQADRLKDQFINALSHELRAPLTVILSTGELLLDGLLGPISEEQRRFLLPAQRATRALEGLVEDLLAINSVRAGKLTLCSRELELAPLVRSLVDELAILAESAGLTLVSDLPDDLPPVWGDARRVIQIFTNLIGNAIKFTPRGGNIIVRAGCQGDRVRCEVRDTGEGIALSDRPKLFHEFSQLANAASHGGTGLGLSICKALVEAHGGEIGVDGDLGEGSSFWFTLPVPHDDRDLETQGEH